MNLILRRLSQSPLGILTASILLVSALRNGLFFDRDFFIIHLVLYSLVAALVINSAVRRQPAWLPTVFWPWMIAAIYLLGLIIGPVSVGATIEHLLRWLSYGCFLLLAVHCTREPMGQRWLHYSLVTTGLFIALWALLTMYRIVDDPFSIQYSQDIRLSGLGMRLAGLFQYANTFGAVCAVFLLYSLVSLLWESDLRHRIITALPLLPLGAALLLSESRGAWLAMAGGWLLGVVVVGRGKRLRYMAISCVVFAASMAVYVRVADAYTRGGLEASAPETLWIGLIGVAAAGAVASLLFEADRPGWSRSIARQLNRPAIWTALSTVSLLTAFGQLPDSVQSRLAGHYDTAASRMLFYRDALRIWRESPVFGFGGDSWRTLYSAYQREPYVGREVHSGYLDLLLDTGLVGLLLLAVMLGLFTIRVWKHHRLAAPALFALFAHSAIDFDLSYGFVWFLAMCLVAPAMVNREESGAFTKTAGILSAILRRLKFSGSWSVVGMRGAWRKTVPLMVSVTLFAAIVLAGRFAVSEYALKWAAAADEPSIRAERLRIAVALNPYSSKARIRYAAEMKPHNAILMLEQGLHYDSRLVSLQWELVQVYTKLDDWAAADHYAQSVLHMDRFNKTMHTEWLHLLYEGVERSMYDGRRQETLERAAKATEVYRQYVLLLDEVERMKRPANGKKFAMTGKATLAAAQSYYILGQHPQARTLFEEVLQTGDEEQRRSAQLYLDRLGD